MSRLPKKDDPLRDGIPSSRTSRDVNAEATEGDVTAVVVEARALFGGHVIDDIVDNAGLVFDKHGVRGVGYHGERRAYVHHNALHAAAS